MCDLIDMIERFQTSDDSTILDQIENIVTHRDFMRDNTRKVDDEGNVSIRLEKPIEYIAYRIKALIWPYLRLARSVRRGTLFDWYRFMDMLEESGNTHLTRENRFQPIIHTGDDNETFMIEEAAKFFNDLHDEEDKLKEQLFQQAFNEWALPALKTALKRVDVSRSSKEIVTYINRVVYTEYARLRAESQGLKRYRKDGKWEYYEPTTEFNEDSYRNQDIMRIIFKRGDVSYPERWERVRILTKHQFDLIDRVEEVIREDIRRNDAEYFHANYVLERMSYRYMAKKIGMNYDAFAKNMQRISRRVFEHIEKSNENVQSIPILKVGMEDLNVSSGIEKDLPEVRDFDFR